MYLHDSPTPRVSSVLSRHVRVGGSVEREGKPTRTQHRKYYLVICIHFMQGLKTLCKDVYIVWTTPMSGTPLGVKCRPVSLLVYRTLHTDRRLHLCQKTLTRETEHPRL